MAIVIWDNYIPEVVTKANNKLALFMKKNGKKPLKIAIIGYGYWGPNLVRVFSENSRAQVVWCCDKKSDRLKDVSKKYPSIKTTKNFDDIIGDKSVDAVIIATPLTSHYLLAKKALLANKHVWVEKPMTKNSEQAAELIEIVKKKKRILFVDHIFLYTPAISYIKKVTDSGLLGKIYYFDSVRINLGLFQPDSNVVWDLAAHDISIMRYLLKEEPTSVSVRGTSHIKELLEDTAYLYFGFASKTSAHIAISWLSPVKIRRAIIGGSRKMILYNELDASEKIKIYNCGVKENYRPDSSTTGYQYRIGDIQTPALENREALQIACEHFIDCIEKNEKPLTDVVEGFKVVRILEAASLSLKNGREEKI